MKKLLLAAAFAMTAPFAASAATDTACVEGGTVGAFDVLSDSVFNCDFNTASANGSVALEFFTNVIPSAAMSGNINLSLVGSYATATLSWFETGGALLSSIAVPINTLVNLQTVFNGPAPDSQTLVFAWTGYTGDALDVNIQVTAVPLPAGMLLMGTALAGFGVMRRRKNRKVA